MPTPTPTRRDDYLAPTHLIETVALDITLAPDKTVVSSSLSVRPNPLAPPGSALRLDGENLELIALKIDGAAVAPDSYRIDDRSLTLPSPPAQPFVLEIETHTDPGANTELTGLYLSDAIYCTQCEAQGFRRITYFPDRPDVLSVYTVRIEADRAPAPVLLSNGNLVEAGEVPGTGRHFARWHDPFPKPCYLFALVAGTLDCLEDHFTTASGRAVDLKIYVDPGNTARAAYAMQALKASMRWDERAFGREYDLDVFMIVAVAAFNFGAMENKGLNIFNDRYILASPDNATDQDYARIEAIIAHEYFHNWTGNRITCRDWFQLCLKEGLTVFRDQEFTADMRSRAVKRIEDVATLRARQFPEDAGPLAHPVRPDEYLEINNFYTPTIYEKGAELIRMARTLVGDKAFARGMDDYFRRHDGRAATVEDLISCLSGAADRDFRQFMKWYAQAGTPTLTVMATHDPATARLTVTVTQATAPTPGQPLKLPLHMPFSIGLIGAGGQEIPLVSLDNQPMGDTLELTQERHSFHFAQVSSRPVLSLNRNFTAPVNLVVERAPGDTQVLMAHDTDPFNRWQAGQDAATDLILARKEAGRTGAPAPDPGAFIEALDAIVGDESLEPAYRAAFLKLPGEAELARAIAHDIDPQAIYEARHWLRAATGDALADQLLVLFERHRTSGGYSPDQRAAGGRTLAHAALAMSAAGAANPGPMLASLYTGATNMADMIGALSILNDVDSPARQTALDGFYRRFSGDHLVVDKWLGLNAASRLPGTLQSVIALTGHDAYSYTNPNRVRALIGTFIGNHLHFNAADGAGFEFLANTVLKLDSINPQIAARLLGGLKNWRMLEPDRRALARDNLEKVKSQAGLSQHVYEIATKSLQ